MSGWKVISSNHPAEDVNVKSETASWNLSNHGGSEASLKAHKPTMQTMISRAPAYRLRTAQTICLQIQADSHRLKHRDGFKKLTASKDCVTNVAETGTESKPDFHGQVSSDQKVQQVVPEMLKSHQIWSVQT